MNVYVIKYGSGHIKCVCESYEQAKRYMNEGYESIYAHFEQASVHKNKLTKD